MTDYTQAPTCAAPAGWRFARIGEREIEIKCPTFSTPLVLSLSATSRHLLAFYSLAADLVEASEQPQPLAVPTAHPSPAEGGGDLRAAAQMAFEMLSEIRHWDHRGDTLEEAWDEKGLGATWRERLKTIRLALAAKPNVQPKMAALSESDLRAIVSSWSNEPKQRGLIDLCRDVAIAQAKATQAPAPAPEVPAGCVQVVMTFEQVQALYLTLMHGRRGGKEHPETRPAFGWMEQPLVEIEKTLAPVHSAIHDRQFNSLNRQFFGDDSRRLPEADLKTSVSASPAVGADERARFEANFAHLKKYPDITAETWNWMWSAWEARAAQVAPPPRTKPGDAGYSVDAEGADEMDRELEEAWAENEALKQELAEFQKATGCEHAEDVPVRSTHRQHGYGTCTIAGPDEDVAHIFSHLPDVDAPEAPPIRTGGCTLCGHCAATGERIVAAGDAPAPSAQPGAWMYEHDGCLEKPIVTATRWSKCEEPWTETPLFGLAGFVAARDAGLIPEVDSETWAEFRSAVDEGRAPLSEGVEDAPEPNEREEFERWAEQRDLPLDEQLSGIPGAGPHYVYVETVEAWEAWQARSGLSKPPVQGTEGA